MADSYTTWSSSFLSPSLEGASDVLASLGAFIVAFRKPSSKLDFDDIKSLLTEVGRVIAGCKAIVSKSGAGEWDGVCLAVGLRRAVVPGLNVTAEDFEDVCQGYGFEFVDGEVDVGKGRKRNEFGGMYSEAAFSESDFQGISVLILILAFLLWLMGETEHGSIWHGVASL